MPACADMCAGETCNASLHLQELGHALTGSLRTVEAA